jgi:hypothetical protein
MTLMMFEHRRLVLRYSPLYMHEQGIILVTSAAGPADSPIARKGIILLSLR